MLFSFYTRLDFFVYFAVMVSTILYLRSRIIKLEELEKADPNGYLIDAHQIIFLLECVPSCFSVFSLLQGLPCTEDKASVFVPLHFWCCRSSISALRQVHGRARDEFDFGQRRAIPSLGILHCDRHDVCRNLSPNSVRNNASNFVLILILKFVERWLNHGLIRFDSSYCIPVFTSFWILLSVASG